MPQGMAPILLLVTLTCMYGCRRMLVSACQQDGQLFTTGEEFRQLEGCSQDYGLFDKQAMTTNARSAIDCARSCLEDDRCLSFIDFPPAHLDNGSHACITVPKQTTNCADLSHYPGGKYYVKVGTFCPSSWTLMYSQSSDSGSRGNVESLADRVRKGARLRVQIVTSSESSIFEVDTVWVEGTGNSVIVTAQVFVMISTLGNGVGIEPHWTRININTTDSKFNLNTVYYSVQYNNVDLKAVYWFIKEPLSECPQTQQTTLLEMDVSEYITQGSYSHVIKAIADGNPIQIVENINPVVKDRSYPAVYAHYDSIHDEIILYGTWIGDYEGAVYTDIFHTGSMLIRLKQNYKTTLFSQQDILDTSKTQAVTEYRFPIVLTADFCWEKVLVHDESGGTIFGSFQQLLDRVLNGYNIRVSYTCVDTSVVRSVTVDKLTKVQENKIIAHVFKSIPLSGTDLNHLKWVHEEIYTSGLVRVITLNRLDGQESVEQCNAGVTWLAEKKKPKLEWFMTQSSDGNNDIEDSANLFPFPTSALLDLNVLPRIVCQTQPSTTNSVTSMESHKLEAVRVLHGDGGNADRVFGVNGHSFKATQLSVNGFGSQHVLVEYLFNVDMNAGIVDTFYHLFDHVQWYF